MLSLQIGLIIFFLLVLFLVCQDEYRKRLAARKIVKLQGVWSKERDRRRAVRIDSEIDVLYEVNAKKIAQKLSSVSRNVSLGGINLVLNERLTTGTVLNLELLNLPNGQQSVSVCGKIVWVKEITLQGLVVWVREIPRRFMGRKEQRLFASGIQFIQLSREAEAILSNFINNKLKQAEARSVEV